jgi:tight adherence protein B
VVIGSAFLLLAVLMLLGVGYFVMLERSRRFALLDRRIAAVAEPVAAMRLPGRMRIPDFVAPLLAQAQIEPTPRMVSIAAGGLALLFVSALALGGAGAALLALLLPAGGIVYYIRQRAFSRVDALIEALPFYLDGVRQLLVVGSSLTQALVRALPSAAIELQAFLGPAVRRIELGAPVAESMQGLAERLCVPEVSMLAAAIGVNLRFGGPMSAVLGNLAQIVRERLRVRRELRSATAEVRVSTRLLMAMPVVMAGFLFFANRAYIDFFLHEPRGHFLGMLAIGLQLAGMLVMRRMMRAAF